MEGVSEILLKKMQLVCICVNTTSVNEWTHLMSQAAFNRGVFSTLSNINVVDFWQKPLIIFTKKPHYRSSTRS